MKKRVIIIGVNGQMGRNLVEAFSEDDDFSVVAGIDLNTSVANPFPVFTSLEKCTVDADLLVDFSKPGALEGNLSYARKNNLPILIATTGYDEAQKKSIQIASKDIPVFYTANMSLGVNVQLQLVKKAAQFIGEQSDIEIIEKHHNRKVDAPSGTALLLADGINETLDNQYHYQFGRGGNDAKRKPHEIGFHSVRGGNLAGDHEVLFIGKQETLTISHHTESRKVFAEGALTAARFILQQGIGLYSMQDIIASDTARAKAKVESNISVISIKDASCTISYLSRLMENLHKERIEVNYISQSSPSQGRVDITFTVKTGNLIAAENCVRNTSQDPEYMIQNGISKFTVYSPNDHIDSNILDRFTSLMQIANIDVMLFTIIDNTFTFYCETDRENDCLRIINELF